MNCNNCGTQNEENAAFCCNCGSPLKAVQVEAEYQPEVTNDATDVIASEDIDTAETNDVVENGDTVATDNSVVPAKKKFKKLFVIIPIVLVIVALVVFLCIKLFGGKYNLKDHSYLFQYSDGETIIISGKKVLGTRIDGEVDDYMDSYDGSVALAVTEDGDLYSVKGKKVKLISEDVDNCYLAAEGKFAAYVDEDGALYYVKISNNKIKHVADDVDSFTLSPDGKALVYSVLTEEESNEKDSDDEYDSYFDDYDYDYSYESESSTSEYAMFLYDGKKSTQWADEEYSVYGVSNKGKYIYASKLAETDDEDDYSSSRELYVFTKNGKQSKLLAEEFEGAGYLNDDHTQILFYADDATFISEKGKTPIEIDDGELYPVYPRAIADSGNYSVDVSDLLNNVYKRNYEKNDDYITDLCFVDKKGNVSKLADDVEDVTMSTNGKYVFYVTNLELEEKDDDDYSSSYKGTADLCKVKAKKNAKEETVVRELYYYYGCDYVISSNGKEVYYLDEDDDLYYVKGNSSGKRIQKDVSRMSMTADDVLMIFADVDSQEYEVNGEEERYSTYTLYTCKGGKKVKEISDNVMGGGSFMEAAYYMVGEPGEYDIYVSNGNDKFKKLTTITVDLEEKAEKEKNY